MDDRDLLQRVADELAIRNVIARLALLADTAPADDIDPYVSLFTEDAVWALPGNEKRGREEIAAGARERRVAGMQGPGTNTRHVITTTAVDVDGSDTATAESYLVFYADASTAPTARLITHYRDTFRREADGWKLARREISLG